MKSLMENFISGAVAVVLFLTCLKIFLFISIKYVNLYPPATYIRFSGLS